MFRGLGDVKQMKKIRESVMGWTGCIDTSTETCKAHILHGRQSGN